MTNAEFLTKTATDVLNAEVQLKRDQAALRQLRRVLKKGTAWVKFDRDGLKDGAFLLVRRPRRSGEGPALVRCDKRGPDWHFDLVYLLGAPAPSKQWEPMELWL